MNDWLLVLLDQISQLWNHRKAETCAFDELYRPPEV